MPERRQTSTCCYASQDKFWLVDPSGYRWEIYHRVEDVPDAVWWTFLVAVYVPASVVVAWPLARVLGPEIRLNTVCPGFIQGDWLEQGMGKETYARTKAFLSKIL